MKTPGFWLGTFGDKFHDVLGIASTSANHDEKLKHGWFIGGEILKSKDGNLWVGDDDSVKCVEKYLGFASECKSNHSHGSSGSSADDSLFQNLTSSSKWNIFRISDGSGKEKYAAFAPAWYTISSYQIVHAFSLSNKLILIILLSSIFTITMSFSSFAYALEDFFRPLKVFKLPTKVMALAVAISIRFVPSLIMEALRIIKAQASRGIDYQNGKLRDKASALLSLFVPLFVISFIKAGELSEAMTARGYNHNHPRNSFRLHIVRMWELMVLFASMFFISILYYFYFHSYYLGLFMTPEQLVMIAR
ncbi:energy-coupling factor transporter transmembrane component T [Candidatus Mycoplasma haematohominis]|uniref:energy-coupling factor transporter transmembrane component T n=1 Tax=Candidatus Mycoplasma haematohominis TaxID=1494318 RepID=UPI001FE7167D|nr:energy-coupling factor transporter transmembrane component T [Candidatus Mycoplasma haemohominis]